MSEANQPRTSKAWYLLAIFVPFIGGFIMFFALRKENRSMAKKGLIVGIITPFIVLVSALMIGGIFYAADNTPEKQKEREAELEAERKQEAERKAIEIKKEPEPTIKEPTLTLSEAKQQALTISYDDLFRNNERHVGTIVHYEGSVVQRQNVYGDTYVLRVDVDEEIFNQEIIWVNYTGSRILEDDIVSIYGTVKGLRTYSAVLGNTVEVPEIDALFLELK